MKKFQRISALCLMCFLLVSFVCSPIEAHAIDPVIGFTAAQSVLFTLIFDFVEWSTLEGVPAVLDGITDLLAPAGRIWLDSFEYQGARMVLTEEARADIFTAVLNGITKMDNLIHPKYKDIEDLTEEDIGFVGDTIVSMTDAEIYSYLSQYFDIQEDIVDLEQNLASTNGILSGISGQVTKMISSFESTYDHFQTTFSAIRTQMVNRMKGLQDTLSTFRTNFLDKIGALQNTASESFGRLGEMVSGLGSLETVTTGIKTSVQTFRTNFLEKIGALQNTASESFGRLGEMVSGLGSLESVVTGIKTSVQTMRQNLVDNFASVRELIAGSITAIKEQVGDRLEGMKLMLNNIWWTLSHNIQNGVASIETGVNNMLSTLADSIAVPIQNIGLKVDEITEAITSYFSPQEPDDEDKNQIVVGGIGSGMSFLGRWGSVLKRYTAGFLAATSIFNVFADMSFFDDLINISICIGIVGSLLGIAMSYAKSDAASKRNASNKGGAT